MKAARWSSLAILQVFLAVLTLSGCMNASRPIPAEQSTAAGPLWLAHYKNALVHIDSQEWAQAESELRAALRLEKESQRAVRSYGMWYQPYLPWLYLGFSQHNQGQYSDARRSLEHELREGVVQSFPELYRQLEALLNTRGPVHVSPPPVMVGEFDRATAISKYFQSRELAKIEGIWVRQDNKYEVAIVRNEDHTAPEYQYVGIVTDTQQESPSRGELKLELKETAIDGVYAGNFVRSMHFKDGATFILKDLNLIESMEPVEEHGIPVKFALIRVYPKVSKPEPGAGIISSSSGTGFFIAKGIIATNWHVVRGSTSITFLDGSERVTARLAIKDETNDLALLRVLPGDQPTSDHSMNCIPIGDPHEVKAGDDVFTIGFPLSDVLGNTARVSRGVVNSSVGIRDDPRMFQVSIPIQPGNSGSPLLDMNGKVIGVITSSLDSTAFIEDREQVPQNVNFAIKVNYLQTVLAMVPHESCEAADLVSPGAGSSSGSVVRLEVGRE